MAKLKMGGQNFGLGHMFTDKQNSALLTVVSDWKQKFPTAEIKGHYETIKTNKTCPNFDVKKWCAKRNLF